MGQPRRASWCFLLGFFAFLLVLGVISLRLHDKTPQISKNIELSQLTQFDLLPSEESDDGPVSEPIKRASDRPLEQRDFIKKASDRPLVRRDLAPVSVKPVNIPRGGVGLATAPAVISTSGSVELTVTASRPVDPHPGPLPKGDGTIGLFSQKKEGTNGLLSKLDSPLPKLFEAIVLSGIEEPELVAPAEKIGAQSAKPPEEEEPGEAEASSPPVESQAVRRLPAVVANIPAPIRAAPHDVIQPSTETPYPNTDEPQSESKVDAPHGRRSADDSWREPDTLLETLKPLETTAATSKWAKQVVGEIRALGPAIAVGSKESKVILDRLAELQRQTPELAKKIPDKALARKLVTTSFALGRRLDVWQQVVLLDAPKPIDDAAPAADPKKLALCLADVDALIGDSSEAQAWRNYLLVDALKASSKQPDSPNDEKTRRLAQQVLARLAQSSLNAQQQKFVSSGPVAAYRAELRRFAAEPVGAAAVLHHIEIFERTALPSDAKRLAQDRQNLIYASIEGRRQLAERLDLHYRNANLRIAVTEELLNDLIPEQKMEYALVDDTVLGRPVRGESLMATEVAVRMLPDPNHVRFTMEVTGKIAAQTTANAGLVRVHNDSESTYFARKPVQIDMEGISTWPVEVGVDNDTYIRGVETPLDGIPLLGPMGKWMAKSQAQQSQPQASLEVRQKIADQASQRVEEECRKRLVEFKDRLNERVFDPLNSLSLDPQMIEAKTTDKRFTMRLLLAGEDQLGSHTPRPQAPGDSLASIQIHESAINNAIQRLQLNGRKFTLPELSQHIADRLNRPKPWEINPDHANIKIAFAEKDAVLVRCQDGRLILKLSIAKLSKSSRSWKNFQIQALYRPEVKGRSAQLVRDGEIQLPVQPKNWFTRATLAGIFSNALSKNNTWELVPSQIVKEPKLAHTAITRFVIDDGWIGVALGPKTSAVSTAQRVRW
jgi:hypothetical protein